MGTRTLFHKSFRSGGETETRILPRTLGGRYKRVNGRFLVSFSDFDGTLQLKQQRVSCYHFVMLLLYTVQYSLCVVRMRLSVGCWARENGLNLISGALPGFLNNNACIIHFYTTQPSSIVQAITQMLKILTIIIDRK